MTEFKSPTGLPIRGTLDRLYGTALINGIDDKGDPVYAGETEVCWDGQENVTRDGKVLYVDESGDTWTFDQLTRG